MMTHAELMSDPIYAMQSALADAAKLVGQQHLRIAVLEELLVRCADLLDRYADMDDGDYGEPEPNAAMRLLSAINEEIT